MDKITFLTEEGKEEEFYVLEQTTVGGISYILVTDSEDDEADAFILKDLSKPDETEAQYEMVSDDEELKVVGDIFRNLLEGVELD